MLQAMDRAHRIGQKKEVQVFRFCVESSIEEKVIEKAYKKLRLDALVIQQGRLTENTKTVNKDDLLSMVRYGAEKVFSSEVISSFCRPAFAVLCWPDITQDCSLVSVSKLVHGPAQVKHQHYCQNNYHLLPPAALHTLSPKALR